MASAEQNIKDFGMCPYCGSRAVSLENQEVLGSGGYRPLKTEHVEPVVEKRVSKSANQTEFNEEKSRRDPRIIRIQDEVNELEYQRNHIIEPRIFYISSWFLWGMLALGLICLCIPGSAKNSICFFMAINGSIVAILMFLGVKNGKRKAILSERIAEKNREKDDIVKQLYS